MYQVIVYVMFDVTQKICLFTTESQHHYNKNMLYWVVSSRRLDAIFDVTQKISLCAAQSQHHYDMINMLDNE